MKLAVAVVQIEPILQRWRALGVFVAAANDVEVRSTVAIGVEEHGAEVFRKRVSREDRLVGAGEAAVAPLKQELSRLPLRATDEDVVESIAVQVGDGEV